MDNKEIVKKIAGLTPEIYKSEAGSSQIIGITHMPTIGMWTSSTSEQGTEVFFHLSNDQPEDDMIRYFRDQLAQIKNCIATVKTPAKAAGLQKLKKRVSYDLAKTLFRKGEKQAREAQQIKAESKEILKELYKNK